MNGYLTTKEFSDLTGMNQNVVSELARTGNIKSNRAKLSRGHHHKIPLSEAMKTVTRGERFLVGKGMPRRAYYSTAKIKGEVKRVRIWLP